MKRCIFYGLIAFVLIASTLIPQKTLSNPSYDEASWRAMSPDTRPIMAARSSGIGGLQADIKKSGTLFLEPSSISYSGGHLHVKIEGEQRTVKVSPNIVQEAIGIVEKADNLVFQVSEDERAVSSKERDNRYIDQTLRDTLIGNQLYDADIEFADEIVFAGAPLPEPRPIYFYKEALRLLKTDAEYRKLATQWESVPESWPQIYLYFDPKVQGLVSLEFKPQVLFRAPFGLPLEVDNETQSLGERPYLPLIKDIKDRPLAYRVILPELDRAAEITATLGLLEAACKTPGSCRDLYSQAASISNKTSESKTNEQQGVEADIFNWQKEIRATRKELNKEWERLNLPVFQPGNTPQAWATAYNVLQKAISGAHEDPNQVEQLKGLTAKQFLNYTVPNDPLLQAALAVIYTWDGKKALAEKKLNQAIQLSADAPRDRIQVLKMGYYVATYTYFMPVPGNSQPERSIQNLQSLMNQARMDAYDEVDKYLQSCIEKLGNCPEQDLLRWEAEAFRAELTDKDEYMQTRDLAWLHGRFAYLVGIQLKEPVKQRDRLRFLSFYAQEAQEEHLSKLVEFETDFKKRLETDSDDWIMVVVIAVVFTFSCLIVQKIRKRKIDEKRRQLERMF